MVVASQRNGQHEACAHFSIDCVLDFLTACAGQVSVVTPASTRAQTTSGSPRWSSRHRDATVRAGNAIPTVCSNAAYLELPRNASKIGDVADSVAKNGSRKCIAFSIRVRA